ncbi:MAG: cytidylate kinase [Lentimonas sp.]
MNSLINKKITIAIDGHSSCGKSTMAKALAKEIGYIYIDTGAMYRGVTLYCLRKGLIDDQQIDAPAIIKSLNNIKIHFEYDEALKKPILHLNNENVEEEIRGLRVSSFVSPIAAIKEVRIKLVALQREMGKKGGVILDGRDIGSVVFPKAELKLFVTAKSAIRAQRRYLELKPADPSVKLEEIQKNIEERDFLDTTRKESPLIKTDDALVLDNSELSEKEQLLWVLDRICEILN